MMLKCRFCSWTHNKYYRNRKGKLVDGQKKLLLHVEMCHEDEYLEIVNKLENELREKTERLTDPRLSVESVVCQNAGS